MSTDQNPAPGKDPNRDVNLMGDNAAEAAEWREDIASWRQAAKDSLNPKNIVKGAVTGGLLGAAGVSDAAQAVAETAPEAAKEDGGQSQDAQSSRPSPSAPPSTSSDGSSDGSSGGQPKKRSLIQYGSPGSAPPGSSGPGSSGRAEAIDNNAAQSDSDSKTDTSSYGDLRQPAPATQSAPSTQSGSSSGCLACAGQAPEDEHTCERLARRVPGVPGGVSSRISGAVPGSGAGSVPTAGQLRDGLKGGVSIGDLRSGLDGLRGGSGRGALSRGGSPAGVDEGGLYSFAAGRRRRAAAARSRGASAPRSVERDTATSSVSPSAPGDDSINPVSQAALSKLSVTDVKKSDLKSPLAGALSMLAGGTALNSSGKAKAAKGLGTALGGPVAGAALGVAVKHKRKLVVLIVALLCFGFLASTMFLTIVGSAMGSAGSDEASGEMDQSSAEAMEGDGVTRYQITDWESELNGTTVPLQIPIAMQRAYGVIPEDSGPEPTDDPTGDREPSSRQVSAVAGQADVVSAGRRLPTAPKNIIIPTEPVGPYAINYAEAIKLYDALDIGGPTNEDGDPVIPMPPPDELESEDTSIKFLMMLLDRRVRASNDLDPDNAYATDRFEAGVVVKTLKDGSQDFALGKDQTSVDAQQQAHDLWVDALSELPTGQADTLAETIYQTALSWRMGDSAACTVAGGTGGTGGAPSGAWANPMRGTITNPFGPDSSSDGLHDGIDIANGGGSPIYAAGSGTARIDHSIDEIYGTHWVKIDHGNGVETHYGHMSTSFITDGQVVTAGTRIGTEGNVGNVRGATGYHLHFSVHIDGVTEDQGFVDPAKFLADRGVQIGVDDPTRPKVDPNAEGNVGGGGVYDSGGTAALPQLGPGQVRIVQANIKSSIPIPGFKEDLAKVVSHAPDFISLNESFTRQRTAAVITPPGYSLWRPGIQDRNTQSVGPAVLWRSSTWRQVEHGTYRLTESPSRLDNRWANWVSLTSTSGEALSVISTHMIINPAKVGGPARQALYKRGMDRLNDLIRSLQPYGPVLIAGDFNSQARTFNGNGDPWGPQQQLKATGMTSTFTALGMPPQGWLTHDGGGTIDYVFFSSGLAPLRHSVFNMNSDHKGLIADLALGGGSGGGAIGGGLGSTTSAGVLPTSYTATSANGETITLDSTQLGYASRIAQKATELGMGENAAIVAFMVAFVETGFRNLANDGIYQADVDLAYSSEAQARPDLDIAMQSMEYPNDGTGTDNDSVGLFQQRNSWGPPKGRIDPYESAGYFFKALNADPSWENKSLGTAAADVQRPAEKYRDRYGFWEQPARELASIVRGTAIGGIAACGTSSGTVAAGEGGGFRIGTINILDAAATEDPRGALADFPVWEKRLDKLMALLSNSGISVAGLQEVSAEQMSALTDKFGSRWSSVGTPGGIVTVFDSSIWSLKEATELKVPSKTGGDVSIPVVELINANGNEITVLNVDHSDDLGVNRPKALQLEKQEIASRINDGEEIYILGDFDDAFDGSSASNCVLHPSVDNVFGGTGSCTRPKGDDTSQHIYHHGAAIISASTVEISTETDRISDHPLVYSNVTYPGAGGALATGDAAAVLNFARAQVGKGYSQVNRHGPATFDCSGLVVMSYAQIFGGKAATEARIGTYTGNMRSKGQEVWTRAMGTKPSTSILQPGDLIFYYDDLGHVALYAGNGRIIHAANPTTGVAVAAYDSMPIYRVVRHLAGS